MSTLFLSQGGCCRVQHKSYNQRHAIYGEAWLVGTKVEVNSIIHLFSVEAKY